MSKIDTPISQISRYISAGLKFLYLYTTEELKTLEILNEVAKETDTEKIYTYDIVRGLECSGDKKLKYWKKEDRQDLFKILDFITENIEGKSFVVFKDIYNLYETDKALARAFKNCIEELVTHKKPITVMSSLFCKISQSLYSQWFSWFPV